MSEDLKENSTLTALSGATLNVTKSPEGDWLINEQPILTPDIMAEDGVVHVVGGLLVTEAPAPEEDKQMAEEQDPDPKDEEDNKPEDDGPKEDMKPPSGKWSMPAQERPDSMGSRRLKM